MSIAKIIPVKTVKKAVPVKKTTKKTTRRVIGG